MSNIESTLIKPKLGVLELAKQLGSVSAACKTMGCIRGTVFTASRSCTRMVARKPYVRLAGV